MTNEERRAAGRRINADTADVWFEYGDAFDPYREHRRGDEQVCIGRVFFAMDPVERIPVWFGDLGEETERALEASRRRVERKAWRIISDDVARLREAGRDRVDRDEWIAF